MKRVVGFLGMALAIVYLTGCVQTDTLVRVKPDGSGTVEETFLMSKEFIQEMQAMMEQLMDRMATDDSAAEKMKKGFEVLDENDLKKKAYNMGTGVSYVSSKKLTTNWGEGYHAIYAFADINELKINENPGENIPEGPIPASPESEDSEEYIRFRFTKGSPATLIIRTPEAKTNEKVEPSEEPDTIENDEAEVPDDPEESDEAEAAMKMEQMKTMFKEMKIKTAVEVEGSIVSTNAAHREGSKIILMEIDFSRLLKNPEKLSELSRSEPGTIEEAKSLLKDVPGMKIELNKEVKIQFK